MKIIRDLKFSKLIAAFIAVMISVLTISSLSAFLNADTLTMELVFDKPIALEFGDGQEYGFMYKATKDGVVDVVSDGDDTIQFLFAVPRETDTQYSNVLHIDYNSMSAEVEAGKTYRIFASCKYLIKNNTRVTFKFIPGGTKVVEINETNFPDANFRKLVSNNFDLSKDGWLTDLEIERVTKIEFLAENITDAKGIEYFTSVKRIDLYANDIASIDLSANTELEYLNLDKNNQITSLDLRRNKKLKELRLFECSLTSLDVSNCPDLRILELYDNDVEKLDLHNNRMLKTLNVCNNRKLTELDLSQNVNLTSLSCFNSNISSLNISKCKKLESINCDDNSLTSLDVSGFSNLKSLKCGWNKISSLNISGCTKLIDLLCANQKGNLKKLDISDCPGLQTAYRLGTEESEGTYVYKNGDVRYDLTVYSNKDLVIIDGSYKPSDKVVKIDKEHFPDDAFRAYISSKFDADGDGYLNRTDIDYTPSIKLYWDDTTDIKDVTGIGYFTNLEEFAFTHGKLTSLDLTKNTALKNICVNNNELTSIDVSKCTNLETLQLYENKLKTLNVKNNKQLKTLACEFNALTSLDIGNNQYLQKALKDGVKTEKSMYFVYKYDGNDTYKLSFDKNVKLKSAQPTSTPTAKPTAKPTANPTTKPGAVSLTLDKKTANVVCGKTVTLKATLKGSTSKIAWKSSDSKIATVDSSGKITAKMAGEVTITATAAGKSAKCKVTVLYKDVTNSKDFWYAPTNYLTAKGVVKGYDKQTKFKPTNDCTRAQMVTFLYRLQGEPKVKSTTCKFTDVKKTDYFFKPVIWATEKGITTGITKNKFGPQSVCTRAQTVTFLWRMAGKPNPKSTKNPFPDVKKTDYFYNATLWASEKKILAGLPDGTFNPQGKCLRRQMVTFLYKYDKFINKKG